jgi:hypothetical protein
VNGAFDLVFFAMFAFVAFVALSEYLQQQRTLRAWANARPQDMQGTTVDGEFPRVVVSLGEAQYFNVEHTSAKGGTTWSSMYRAPIAGELVARTLFLPSVRRQIGWPEIESDITDPLLRNLVVELVRTGLDVAIAGGQLAATRRVPGDPTQVYENLKLIERILARARELAPSLDAQELRARDLERSR